MAEKSSNDPGVNATTISRRQLLVGGGVLAGGVLLGGGLSSCSSDEATSPEETTSGSLSPKAGGTFRLGVTGGGSGDIIDGQNIVTKPDQARLVAGFEGLMTRDDEFQLVNDALAEEVTQDKPDQWTIRIKDGIEFHDGKTLTADDVVYSLQRIIDPDEGLFGQAGLAYAVSPKGIKKMDDRTVRLELTQPDSSIADQFGQYYNGIVPEGYTRKGEQIGTGPYKLQSFTPGEQSTHVKNPNYWRSGQPYFDEVTVIDFPDPSAQVNALLSGEVDAITDIPFAQIEVAKQQGLSILETQGGSWLPICMAIDLEPFTDARVRQAFRLMANRDQLLQQVLSGHGRLGNDIFGILDPCYDTSLPQREQDLEQAKSLLDQAGMAGMTIDLHTTPGAAGMVDLAKAYAEQTKGAGVTVNVKVDQNYYGDQYLKLPFSVDFWGARTFFVQASASMLPTSPYNETHWPPNDSNYLDLLKQALAEVDDAKRCDIIHEMQGIEHEQGGYIIPFFNNLIDAYGSKVQGFVTAKSTLNLNTFGHGYRTIWFA